jgi:hypothetical protein
MHIKSLVPQAAEVFAVYRQQCACSWTSELWGQGTEVRSPEVYEGIESEQNVFPAFREDDQSRSRTKFHIDCLNPHKIRAS